MTQYVDVDFAWGHTGEYQHHKILWPAIQRALPTGKGLRILDAGCGTGFIAHRLSELGHEVTAIDSSPQGLEMGCSAYPDVHFHCVSVYEDLSGIRPDGGWDAIVSSEVIEHLFYPRKFVDNLYRNLHLGGTVIITTPYHGYLKNLTLSLADHWDQHHGVDWEGGHIKFFSVATLTAMLSEAGFKEFRFDHVGRMRWLWKSMVCSANKK